MKFLIIAILVSSVAQADLASELDKQSERNVSELMELGKNRLRDEFAAAALTGLISATNLSPRELSKRSYEIADAMIKARGEK